MTVIPHCKSVHTFELLPSKSISLIISYQPTGFRKLKSRFVCEIVASIWVFCNCSCDQWWNYNSMFIVIIVCILFQWTEHRSCFPTNVCCFSASYTIWLYITEIEANCVVNSRYISQPFWIIKFSNSDILFSDSAATASLSSSIGFSRGLCFAASKAIDGIYMPVITTAPLDYESVAHTGGSWTLYIQLDLRTNRCV